MSHWKRSFTTASEQLIILPSDLEPPKMTLMLTCDLDKRTRSLVLRWDIQQWVQTTRYRRSVMMISNGWRMPSLAEQCGRTESTARDEQPVKNECLKTHISSEIFSDLRNYQAESRYLQQFSSSRTDRHAGAQAYTHLYQITHNMHVFMINAWQSSQIRTVMGTNFLFLV